MPAREGALVEFASGDPLQRPHFEQEFKDLSIFNARFRPTLRRWCTSEYRWPVDPLHHWSRIWEYPFVSSQIRMCAGRGGRALDIGSATTFFPFYVAKAFDLEVVALDSDPGHTLRFTRCSRAVRRQMGIARLPTSLEAPAERTTLDDESFDIVYSVSVVEHILDPIPVVHEIRRILRPGGIAVLTLDRVYDPNGPSEGISLAALEHLTQSLEEAFGQTITIPEVPEDVLTSASPRQFKPDERRPLACRMRPLTSLPLRLVQSGVHMLSDVARRPDAWAPNICVLGLVLKKECS